MVNCIYKITMLWLICASFCLIFALLRMFMSGATQACQLAGTPWSLRFARRRAKCLASDSFADGTQADKAAKKAASCVDGPPYLPRVGRFFGVTPPEEPMRGLSIATAYAPRTMWKPHMITHSHLAAAPCARGVYFRGGVAGSLPGEAAGGAPP